MKVLHVDQALEKKIETFPYKGKDYQVKEVFIRWLSQAGPLDSPDYGLRYFRIGPGGEIPLHKHLYYQTMYILSGRALCRAHDPESDAVTAERQVGAGEVVFLASMEPHSMANLSDNEDVTFLCCIANVYEED